MKYWKYLAILAVAVGVVLLATMAGRLNLQETALDMAREFPPFPEAEYEGEFKTGLPDGRPGGGLSYLSDAPSGEILTFFQEVIPDLGWELKEFDDPENDAIPKQLVFRKDKWLCRILIYSESGRRRITILVER